MLTTFQDRIRNRMEESFEQWCRQLLQTRFEDPEISKKVIQLMSTFCTKALTDRPAFALTFLEHMLTVKLSDNTSLPAYSDAVKDLERISSLEMQKLAMKFPDDFIVRTSAPQEASVQSNSCRMCTIVWSARSMRWSHLLILMTGNEWLSTLSFSSLCRSQFSLGFCLLRHPRHRSTTLDRATQEARMKHLLTQVKDAWRNEELTKSVSSFQAFCGVLGMDRLPEFLSANNFRGVQDWSEQSLPADGQTLQATISERSNVCFFRLH